MNKDAMQIRALNRLPPDFWPQRHAAPWRYDLFQLLRRIDAQGGLRYPLGRAPLPRHEPIRLGQQPSLAFAPATLAAVSQRDGSALQDISIFSFGLFGPNGPLPLHMTEYARERQTHHQDHSLTAFADIFHHRLTLLFYRAWADAQPTVSLDRPDDRRFENYLACLIGMGQPGQLDQSDLSSHARFSVAGHLSRQAHNREGLEKSLRHFFQVPVTVLENVPHWMALETNDQAQLRGRRGVSRLGENAFLGKAIHDRQHKIRIEIGPLSHEDYGRFLPQGDKSRQLRDWLRQYLGIEYLWDVRLTLAASAVSGVQLGGAQQLGYSSWLGQQSQGKDRGDLLYQPEQISTSHAA